MGVHSVFNKSPQQVGINMEIGYAINAFYPCIGGTETYMLNLLDFVSKYHNVHVYTTTARTGNDFRFVRYSDDKIRVKHHRVHEIDVYRSDVTQFPIVARQFVDKYQNAYRFNQHAQNSLSRQITVLFNWGFSFGMCRRLLSDKLDIIHFTSLPLLHTHADSLIAKVREIPSVFFPSFHKGTDHEAILNKIPFKFATKVIVHGLDEKRDIQHFFKVPDEKIEIIPSPVRLEDFSMDIKMQHFPELEARQNIPRVLFIGRLLHGKGFVFLFETMVELWKRTWILTLFS